MDDEELLDLQRTTLRQLNAHYADVPMGDLDDESDHAPEPDDEEEVFDVGTPYRPMTMPPQRMHNNAPITYGVVRPHPSSPPPPPRPPTPPRPPSPLVGLSWPTEAGPPVITSDGAVPGIPKTD
jgi:hypothetical protein